MSRSRPQAHKPIMDAEAMRRTISRLAHEIIESDALSRSAVLVGIFTRGVPLAHRIAELVASFEGIRPQVGELDITYYRDDLPLRKPGPSKRSNIGVDLTGREVILVDDVLYTGRTVRAALDALIDYGRPSAVRLAALVDRGHREFPIRADFVGKNIPTSADELVVVHLNEIDGEDAVFLRRLGESERLEAAK